MDTKFLFPRQFRLVGWMLFLPGLLAALFVFISGYDGNTLVTTVPAMINEDLFGKPESMLLIENGIADELILIMLIAGGILAGFSKVKNEDELISKIRLESLVWAVYVNFGIVLFATLFVYGLYFFNVMLANMFTVLIFFLLRFHLMLYKLRNSISDEE